MDIGSGEFKTVYVAAARIHPGMAFHAEIVTVILFPAGSTLVSTDFLLEIAVFSVENDTGFY
jgi:hypothetical protein